MLSFNLKSFFQHAFFYLCVISVVQCACVLADVSETPIYDDTQTELSTVEPARRIVALAPHIVENLFAIGAQEYIVATVEHADFPSEAKTIPRVGSVQGMSIEAIVAYQPDLVILWYMGQATQMADKLRQLGLKVYADDPRTLDDVVRSLRHLSLLVFPDKIPHASIDFEQRVNQLQARYANRKTVRVYYQLWQDPPMTLNGAHIISDAISLCGGKNVFSQAPVLVPTVSKEAVLAADPEVMIMGASSVEDKGDFSAWYAFNQIKAVANAQFYTLPADWVHRHTPRFLDGVQRLCDHLESVRKNTQR